MRASVLTADGVFLVDLEDGSVLGPAATANFEPASRTGGRAVPPPARGGVRRRVDGR
jgi:hypothetical protein